MLCRWSEGRVAAVLQADVICCRDVCCESAHSRMKRSALLFETAKRKQALYGLAAADGERNNGTYPLDACCPLCWLLCTLASARSSDVVDDMKTTDGQLLRCARSTGVRAAAHAASRCDLVSYSLALCALECYVVLFEDCLCVCFWVFLDSSRRLYHSE